MRRFAQMNFQITINADSKLSYTPCYVQVWLIKVECLIRELNKNFKRKRREEFLNLKYLYIKENNERFETIY